MDISKYSVFLFDLDNTLMDFAKASKDAFQTMNVELDLFDDPDVYQTYKKINAKVWEAFEKHEIDGLELRKRRFDLLLKEYGIEADPLELNKNYLNNLIRFPYVLEGVERVMDLLANKSKVSIITNGLKEVQRPRIKAADLEQYCSFIVVSDEIGSAKPHRSYFDHVFTHIEDVPKSEVLVIGDNLMSDIKGGKEYGLDTCWINFKNQKNTTEIQPDYILDAVGNLKI